MSHDPLLVERLEDVLEMLDRIPRKCSLFAGTIYRCSLIRFKP